MFLMLYIKHCEIICKVFRMFISAHLADSFLRETFSHFVLRRHFSVNIIASHT